MGRCRDPSVKDDPARIGEHLIVATGEGKWKDGHVTGFHRTSVKAHVLNGLPRGLRVNSVISVAVTHAHSG